MRLVICDDDPVIRYLLEIVLGRSAGHEVVATGDPAEIPTLVATHDPDAVLLDFTLPETSGAELASRLAGSPTTRHVPVVFLTGRADLGAADLRAPNVAGVIVKPFSTQTLDDEIRGLIRSRRAPSVG